MIVNPYLNINWFAQYLWRDFAMFTFYYYFVTQQLLLYPTANILHNMTRVDHRNNGGSLKSKAMVIRTTSFYIKPPISW
jgi:hypothetical protein